MSSAAMKAAHCTSSSWNTRRSARVSKRRRQAAVDHKLAQGFVVHRRGALKRALGCRRHPKNEHRVRYIREPFKGEPDFGATSVNYSFAELLARAESASL
jgi:hypothetical protein